MIFSRTRIEEALKSKEIVISPFSEEHVRDASYVLHLDIPKEIMLMANDFILLKTVEKITLSPKIACFITTNGKAAGVGIDACQSSLFCEPNTDNQIALEISNSTKQPIKLEPGMKIAKAVFVAVI